MKTLITLLLGLVGLAWGWDLLQAAPPAGAHPMWVARQQLLTLSGFLSIALMSLVMLLATRPAWLETPLGGMDRIYRTHKWAGILAVVFAALHWLIEMSGDIIKALIGREGRVPKESFTGLLEVLRDLAAGAGAALLALGVERIHRLASRLGAPEVDVADGDHLHTGVVEEHLHVPAALAADADAAHDDASRRRRRLGVRP